MTNGEKLCFDFPDVTTRTFQNEGFIYITVERNDEWVADFDTAWWYAEYKEPTTKNKALDKLRAEIDLETRVQVKHYTNTEAVIDAVLEIIDKYKAESEGKEC